MRSPLFSLFSLLVLGFTIPAQAEGLFGPSYPSSFQAGSEPGYGNDYGPNWTLNRLPQPGVPAPFPTHGNGVMPVSYYGEAPCCDEVYAPCCDDPCGECCAVPTWGECCPGTGAFGGDSVAAATLGLNQDTFFGFYGTLSAGYAINSRTDITVYSILWTTPWLSAGGFLGGNDLQGFGPWTEFGGGLNFKRMGGALNINPQVGILNGALLSGFTPAGNLAAEPRAFEGIVPNLTVNYDDTYLESQFYMGYYIGLRGQVQNDFLHWWYNAGVKPWGASCDWRQIVSFGAHYEMLRQTAPATATLYSWLGPYFQVALPNGLTARFAAGWNMENQDNFGRDFYKVNIGYDF